MAAEDAADAASTERVKTLKEMGLQNIIAKTAAEDAAADTNNTCGSDPICKKLAFYEEPPEQPSPCRYLQVPGQISENEHHSTANLHLEVPQPPLERPPRLPDLTELRFAR